MSYNIDSFKVSKLENFKIAVKSFDKKIFGNPEIDFDTNRVSFYGRMCEECEFEGVLEDGFVTLDKIRISGEGSGHFMATFGDSLLKNSTGKLKAVLVWESGDTIERLSIVDGVSKTKNIK